MAGRYGIATHRQGYTPHSHLKSRSPVISPIQNAMPATRNRSAAYVPNGMEPGGAYNGKITVIKDAIHHASQYHVSPRTPAHPTEPPVSIRFCCRKQCRFQEMAGGKNRCPGRLTAPPPISHPVQEAPQVIGNLFADHIPFGFDKVMIPLVIKPDRTCIHPYYIRNRYMFLKLLQDYSSCRNREPE